MHTKTLHSPHKNNRSISSKSVALNNKKKNNNNNNNLESPGLPDHTFKCHLEPPSECLRTFQYNIKCYLHFIKSSILFHQQHERLQALKWSCSAACFQDETTTSHKHTTLTEKKRPIIKSSPKTFSSKTGIQLQT